MYTLSVIEGTFSDALQVLYYNATVSHSFIWYIFLVKLRLTTHCARLDTARWTLGQARDPVCDVTHKTYDSVAFSHMDQTHAHSLYLDKNRALYVGGYSTSTMNNVSEKRLYQP
jgi:hypothetical protein